MKSKLEQMMGVGIIKPIEESEWISLMVVQDKSTNKIRICVDLRKINDTSLHDPFPKPFTDKLLEGVRG